MRERRGEDSDAAGARGEDLVADDERLKVRHTPPHRRDRVLDAAQPALGQIVFQAADAIEHVVHPAAGDLLHDLLEFLALAEGVEDRSDRAEFERVGPEEHQVVEHPVQLGKQSAGPHGAHGHFHAEHRLDPKHHAEFVAERREPVVPVGQHDDLAVVADLEKLLGSSVHVADDRVGRDDPLAVNDDLQPQDAMRRRMLWADIEDHVGRGQAACAHPDRQFRRGRCRAHPATLWRDPPIVAEPASVVDAGGLGAGSLRLPPALKQGQAHTFGIRREMSDR